MRLRLLLVLTVLTVGLAAATAIGASVPTIFTISTSLNGPQGLAIAPDGSVFVADTIAQKIKRLDPNGGITTIAGTGDSNFSGDGGPATQATFQDPTGIALAPDGSLYVADTGNNRLRVIRPGGTIATVAGTASQGFSGDNGPAAAAQVNEPRGVAVDSRGRVFFSDSGNNRVRFIDTDGTIHSLAAQFKGPTGLAFAFDGALLVADTGNNVVKRIATDGSVKTVAGNGGGGSGGDGGPATSAQLNLPVDVAPSPTGGYYIAEQGGHRIRLVAFDGMIRRVAGTGAPRFGGDGRAATGSYVNSPHAIEVSSDGTELLIADTDNNRLRYITFPGESATRLALAPAKAVVRLPLVKKKIVVKKRHRRILVVTDKAIGIRSSKASTVTFRIATKKGGKLVATLKKHAPAGAYGLRLPARLRSGKHRLNKDHYVVRVTAKAGSRIATTNMELIVK